MTGDSIIAETKAVEVTEICNGVSSWTKPNLAYDIVEVPETHNYIANGIVVHNSFGAFGVVDGELFVRSKGAQLHLPTEDKLFKGFTETAQQLYEDGKLVDRWVYRGEVISKNKHNSLTYNTVPNGFFVLFDVLTGDEIYSSPDKVKDVALEIGVTPIRNFVVNETVTIEQLKELLETESQLGGPKIEGVVIKDYNRFGRDGKVMMAKLVRPEFREVNKENWKEMKQSPVESIISKYTSEARWSKAVQHLRDRGELTGTVKDIGPLLKEVPQDILEECKEEIMEELFNHYWKDIKRGVVRGLPVWYKERVFNDLDSL